MRKWISPILLAGLFVLFGGLTAYAYWLYQVDKANEAALNGSPDRAILIYEKASAIFTKFPWLARILRDDYQKLTFNQVRMHYLAGQSEEAIETLERGSFQAPFMAETAEYAFWAGNLMVRKALQTKDRTDSLDMLKEALETYQRGLALRPDDWDIKYNYELVRYLLSLRAKDETKGAEKAKSILEKMRPAADPFRDNLPLEKRG